MQTCYTAGLVEGAQTTLGELGTSMGSFTTHIMSKIKEIMAHMTTSASIKFQISRKYDPG